jgi:hypothetical protein
VRFDVFTAVMMMFFWILEPCRIVGPRVYTAPKPRRTSSTGIAVNYSLLFFCVTCFVVKTASMHDLSLRKPYCSFFKCFLLSAVSLLLTLLHGFYMRNSVRSRGTARCKQRDINVLIVVSY